MQRVVLSNRHHLRDGAEIAARFGCPILCHEAGLHEFAGGGPLTGNSKSALHEFVEG